MLYHISKVHLYLFKVKINLFSLTPSCEIIMLHISNVVILFASYRPLHNSNYLHLITKFTYIYIINLINERFLCIKFT